MNTKQTIRVAQFTNSIVRFGAEEVALGLFHGLDPERFRTYFVSPPVLLEACDNLPHNERVFGLDFQNPWQWPQNWQFLRFLKSERIDIVHAHMTRAALAAVPLARLAGVPVVVQTCHGREGWRQTWSSRQYWVDRRLTKWTDATIAVSESTKRYLVTQKKLDPDKIIVIPNGISMNGSHPDAAQAKQLRAKLGILPGALVMGVFARLEEQKGHRYLVEALPAVRNRVGGVKVLLVGEGRLRPILEQRVADLGLSKIVIFTGYRKDAQQLMRACDLVVLPSLYEGMPLVPIEAAALGKAVLATSVEGACDVIVDGLTGVLVPPRNPAALADAMIHLLLNPSLRDELGERARERACELYSQERHLRDSAACYERLLAKRWSLPLSFRAERGISL